MTVGRSEASCVRLRRYPEGEPSRSDFEVGHSDVPAVVPGEASVAIRYLAADPYLRLRMAQQRIDLGSIVPGQGVGVVVESHVAGLVPGDWVTGTLGWTSHAVVSGSTLRKFEPGDDANPYEFLGLFGLGGFAAWLVSRVARPAVMDCVYINAAAGTVGSLIGQLLAVQGAKRIIGSTGSRGHIAWLHEIGFDEVFNYRDREISVALADLAPDGVSLAVDCVGGDSLGGILRNMRSHGLICVAGASGSYGVRGAEMPVVGMEQVFLSALTMSGIRVEDHWDEWSMFVQDMRQIRAEHGLAARVDIRKGLHGVVDAFVDRLGAGAAGKVIIEV